ncbi:PIN domain-like protein [Xylariaceae sp. FL0255]|nr:PIN domain-like protein [Xylariaceae sp. FL0255]
MGVNGLWTVIQPCARPTNLATLNHKRLAVDASIWIYQFLKAVRDKEGNALRNSHVVGFFRRICKLLWFGIRPVFVFDGGAPALKRQTITGRKRRREGRREDAVRTAGKLLAVQMHRIAEEESEKRRRRQEQVVEEPVEEIPDVDKLVYASEVGMSQQERMKNRKFFKQDAYHLPDLHGSIEGMGRPEDPRIMSIEELEEYARQFQSGEDINLYDFSKIDFEGDFFKSLPPADRYNILNAARLRSRLRMGLSKEQLDGMFPDRMAFSRFQIERVKERNHLTQRLMKEAGMTGTDLTLGGGGRIAGEKDREYILVKNDGAEGGWALGVVSREKDIGEIHKPIDVDAIDLQFQTKDEDFDEDEDEFEDVPITGLNRLPRLGQPATNEASFNFDKQEEESLFVDPDVVNDHADNLFGAPTNDDALLNDEEEDLNRAIALSLKNQHGVRSSPDEEEEQFEDVPAPEWTQKAVEPAKPVTSASGSMIAHIVNNRANAAVPKRRQSGASISSSDSEVDLRTALSAARKKKSVAPKPAAPKPQPDPVRPNVKNPFGGPLPFEKLDWKSSIFAPQKGPPPAKPSLEKQVDEVSDEDENAGGFLADGEEMAGGFLVDEEESNEARPLPPWMMQDESDIRKSIKARQAEQAEEDRINEENRITALEEEKRLRDEAVIEIDSSDSGNDSDVEIVDAPPVMPPTRSQVQVNKDDETLRLSPATLTKVNPPAPIPEPSQANKTSKPLDPPPQDQDSTELNTNGRRSLTREKSSSPEPEFEEVDILEPPEEATNEGSLSWTEASPGPDFEDVDGVEAAPVQEAEPVEPVAEDATAEVFGDDEFDDEFSDPEDEELLAQMAEEAEEHARFASQLNNKSTSENQEAYERELKALRTQQKKDRRDADEVTQIMITECQALLRYFGIPYITAPMEAEAQCAELVKLGLVDGIVTDDSDIFLFGGTRVYKNMFNSNKFVECYLGSDLERELSLSREQLISIAQLLGSDYTEGLPGVGPVTAVEILSEFPGKDGLDAFREWWSDVQIRNRPNDADKGSTFRKKFRKSQGTKLFLPPGFPSPAVFDAYLHPEVDSNAEAFQWGSPDVEGLRQFLMSTIGWSQERTDEVLVPVIRDMNRREAEGTQSNITRYFKGSVGVGAKPKEAFAPRHRVATSKRMTEAVNKLRSHAVISGMETASIEDGQQVEEDESLAPTPGNAKKRKAGEADNENGNGDEDYEDETDRQTQKGKGKRQAKGKPRGNGKKAKASS